MAAAPKDRVQILDSSGNPLAPARPKVAGLNGGGYLGGSSPYDAADVFGQRMADWQPYLGSASTDLNAYRDRIAARVRDLVRNDGWAAGGVTKILDNAVGASLRPIAKPDYRSLAQYTGISAFDSSWAKEFGKAAEAHWRAWAEDVNRYCDAARNLTVSQILRLAFRHKLVDGDALAVLLWLPDRVGAGRGRYCTTVQLIDPDRLSNPQMGYDLADVRGGVKIDRLGAASGYYIRRAHQADWYKGADSLAWDLVPRETAWGRPIVVHDFDADRAGQYRGGAGVLTPVLQRLKMLVKYDGTELDSAIINAIFGAYVTSPFDPQMVGGALGDDEVSSYQEQRSEFHREFNLKLGGARIPILFPGESINAVTATRPNSAFADFQSAMLRNVAAALNISYEQMSQDWSKSNYSSARGAILEAWKTIGRRRQDFAAGFAAPIFAAFLEESMDVDDLPLPAGAPPFEECRTAYAACRWLGPGRGWVDPVKEKQGAQMGIEMGISTLEAECAEAGVDWEEVLDQRQLELEGFKERGLEIPAWGAPVDQVSASEKVS